MKLQLSDLSLNAKVLLEEIRTGKDPMKFENEGEDLENLTDSIKEKAQLSQPERNTALAELLTGGWVKAKGTKFKLTDEAKQFYEVATQEVPPEVQAKIAELQAS